MVVREKAVVDWRARYRGAVLPLCHSPARVALTRNGHLPGISSQYYQNIILAYASIAIQMLANASLELSVNIGLYFLCFQCRIYNDGFAENGGVRHEERVSNTIYWSTQGSQKPTSARVALSSWLKSYRVREEASRRLVTSYTAPNETQEIAGCWMAHREGTG